MLAPGGRVVTAHARLLAPAIPASSWRHVSTRARLGSSRQHAAASAPQLPLPSLATAPATRLRPLPRRRRNRPGGWAKILIYTPTYLTPLYTPDEGLTRPKRRDCFVLIELFSVDSTVL